MLNKADMLLYGGAAGGGKSNLAIGLALTQHARTLFVRKEIQQLLPVVDRISEIVGGRTHYHAQDKTWRFPDGRVIQLGGVAVPGDEGKYQGASRDLLVIDEAANILEYQAQFLCGWVRSTDPNQRCRILLCSNPPTTAEGEYLVRMFGAWLDPTHPRPAVPGELRWYVRIDGRDTEVADGTPFERNGETLLPQSRSFIPAKAADNAFLRDSGYVATLQSLPEPLRSQMLVGDFTAGVSDPEWQCIPTAWIQAAQARWTARTDPGTLTSMGVDVARGGSNDTVISRKYGWWFAELDIFANTVKGSDTAMKCLNLLGDSTASINVDVIGVGTSVYDFLEAYIGEQVRPINSASKADEEDRTGNLSFHNLRAQLWWKFREMLAPESPYEVALPPDARLLSDLAAPLYRLGARGILIESKQEIPRDWAGRPTAVTPWSTRRSATRW
ncbi:terminase [Gammaproteobacteria bacterium]|nr:terminase [Gammaproteobacteria bacterium]